MKEKCGWVLVILLARKAQTFLLLYCMILPNTVDCKILNFSYTCLLAFYNFDTTLKEKLMTDI